MAAVLDWYAVAARDLPWRGTGTSAWGVLVSEVMLQQTPVSRVVPAWTAWLVRWPTPAMLAAEPAGEAVRAWGRLGYPRRALRLHTCAVAITELHGGAVPGDLGKLHALPGVGSYTAAAVASFAFGQRHAVLDTNVRRVLARALVGQAGPSRSLTVAEQRRATKVLPDEPSRAVWWAAASMELGALVCTARSPRCDACPVVTLCAWRLAGYPATARSSRRPHPFAGSDRQVRGIVLGAVAQSVDPVPAADLDHLWDDEHQRARALEGLVGDGLLEHGCDGTYALPS